MVDCQAYPLIVDLDDTLIHTDMLHESALQRLHRAPLAGLTNAMAFSSRQSCA